MTARYLDSETIDDPYPYFAALRADAPVHWNEQCRGWFVARYCNVAPALRDPAYGSDRITPYIERRLAARSLSDRVRLVFEVLRDWMVFKDAHDHRRLRSTVQRAFTPASAATMRSRIEAIADDLLDGLEGRDGFDALHDFAGPLPAIVIAEILGVPPHHRARFTAWSHDIMAVVFGDVASADRHDRAAEGMAGLVDYLSGLLEGQAGSDANGLLAALSRAEEGQQLSRAEVLATGTLFLFGGHETTATLISNALVALFRDPDALAAVRDDDDIISTAVDELLRFDGPAKAVLRIVGEEPIELRGRRLLPGQRVFLLTGSANRDREKFEAPDRLVLDRSPNQHVAFGLGPHFCLGAALARLEAEVALPRLLRRFPSLRPAVDRLTYEPIVLNHTLTALPVAP